LCSIVSSPDSVIPPLSTLGDFFDGCYKVDWKHCFRSDGLIGVEFKIILQTRGCIVERYITDTIYAHTVTEKTAEIELREKQLYTRLSALISGEEYLQIEEELNRFYNELEKEGFYKGFSEGIRFMLKCL
jgi:hypothetical protein